MRFEPLPEKFDFPTAEKEVLRFWKEHDVFHKSLEQRRNAERFVFYEGPPTANGMPHPGHCLTRAMKDIYPRYQTMCGKLVERKAGWDTHGLPVEVEVCKELGIHGKEEIEKYGLEPFVRKCVESVWKYTRQWEEMTSRLGFWVDLDQAYATYHQSYVESVWWSLKTLFERGLLYQGHKVVWWWAQGGTALSAGEVGEGYRTVDDPSVFVKFPLVEGQTLTPPGRTADTQGSADVSSARFDTLNLPERTSLLVWTTTPWTLISNHFAAVNPELEYALVSVFGRADETSALPCDSEPEEYLIIAKDLVETIGKKIKRELVIDTTISGSKLTGARYRPPFDCFSSRWTNNYTGSISQNISFPNEVNNLLDSVQGLPVPRRDLKAGGSDTIGWRVLAADFVTTDSGTGIVHLAPAYGEVDFELLQKERKRFKEPDAIPLLNAVAPNGKFTDDAPERYRRKWVKDCDKDIVRELRDERKTPLLLHAEQYRHEYPFCPRAENDPLIQYARKSWFVRTSQFKDEFLRNNDTINWLPEHIKEGRFGDFLRNNVDWALSRERYWGTPLPIWQCEQCGRMEAIGSLAELRGKPNATDHGYWDERQAAATAEGKPLLEDLRVHRPYIDAWTYDCGKVECSANHNINQAISSLGRAGVSSSPMRRVVEVIDCWWDAGSMPFAQWGFPHVKDSPQKLAERFPADFISEAIDQTRGWFYALLSINTLLSEDIKQIVQGSTYFITFRVAQGQLSGEERSLVLNACRHWDERRMSLHAAVVMPDHVHLLLTPIEKAPGEWWSLADLMHSIKGFSAKEVNARRGESGQLWQAEFFDRIIRTEADFLEKWNYITTNPLRRGLPESYEWVWVEPAASNGGLDDRSDGDICGRDARTPSDARLDICGRDARTPSDARLDSCGRDARTPLSRDARTPLSSDARTPLSSGGYPIPFKTCIVLGHMMGEDGAKMSKRLKNYREPGYIFDGLGADAMRWYFFSGQFPWTTARFQEAAIRDAHRDFLVRLYNVFSFFNIYANIDGFTLDVDRRGGTGWRPTGARAELDRWILSELHLAIRSVRESMDRFENFPAAQRLKDFVDALSNWYVRRSRDRFWRAVALDAGDANQDKWDAYNTLYEVLLSLSKLIAPFTPFFAEVMYGNLAGVKREAQSAAMPVSVHLCDYPVPDESVIDEALSEEMNIVREIASLGRAARTAAKLKVRQPLARVEIILARHEHEEWLRRHAGLIVEELNVKQVEFTSDADHYVHYEVKPNFKAIGPRFGKQAPQIAAALKKLADPGAARRTLIDSGELPIELDGQTVRLTAEDVEIRLEAREGWSAAQGRAGVVVLSTEITPELRDEGVVRELIHHIQQQRKERNLAYEARISVGIVAEPAFRSLIERFADVIREECLAVEIHDGVGAEAEATEASIEGAAVRLSIREQ